MVLMIVVVMMTIIVVVMMMMLIMISLVAYSNSLQQSARGNFVNIWELHFVPPCCQCFQLGHFQPHWALLSCQIVRAEFMEEVGLGRCFGILSKDERARSIWQTHLSLSVCLGQVSSTGDGWSPACLGGNLAIQIKLLFLQIKLLFLQIKLLFLQIKLLLLR